MKYRIQQYCIGRWRSVLGIPESQQVFDDADTAQNSIDELRQHPEWTMAQMRVVPVRASGEMEAQRT